MVNRRESQVHIAVSIPRRAVSCVQPRLAIKTHRLLFLQATGPIQSCVDLCESLLDSMHLCTPGGEDRV